MGPWSITLCPGARRVNCGGRREVGHTCDGRWPKRLQIIVSLLEEKGAQETLRTHDVQYEHIILIGSVENPARGHDHFPIRCRRQFLGSSAGVWIALEPFNRSEDLANVATLLGCQGIDEFTRVLPAALNLGVTPVEAKEIVYQATAYLGIGRVSPFLSATNEVLERRGVKLPLPGQSTTTRDSRLVAGIQTLVDIVGDRMKDFWKSGPEETRHVRHWVTDNCFGDYYTRNGLDNQEREMITFCFLAAQGGCEPQLTSHAKANMRIGNDKAFLIKVVSQCLPYIGYPRSLNALRCVDDASRQD